MVREFNSQTATQIAKLNIERDYAVVGTWEETNITLTVLEHYIPRFFKDATEIFYSRFCVITILFINFDLHFPYFYFR